MAKVCISVGSNYGCKRDNVKKALVWLGNALEEVDNSSIYETPEIHGFGPSYFNAVLSGSTILPYSDFNRMLKEYEIRSGRTPEAKMRKEVVIDLDIVIWNAEIVRPEDFKRQFFQIGYNEISI